MEGYTPHLLELTPLFIRLRMKHCCFNVTLLRGNPVSAAAMFCSLPKAFQFIPYQRISYNCFSPKVMVLLIFFLVAFAAAFTVIMNDREGYQSFGLSMLTSATMTMGEFDFKQTFLTDEYYAYNDFYWLRIFHLAVFLVVMPIIIMNLLLALAIDDTSSIMQQAKLQKHIQTVS